MNPTIVISKNDDHYLITTLSKVRIFDKYEDASEFIRGELDDKEDSVAGIPWVSEIIKEG